MNITNKLNIKTHRPPNIAIGLLLTGFGMIHVSNLLIVDAKLRSIIMGIAQSIIFLASIMKKIENQENGITSTPTNDPFNEVINTNPITLQPENPANLPETVIADGNHAQNDGVLASAQISMNV